MAKANVLIRAKKAKAVELLNGNRLDEADAAYAALCLRFPGDADLWVARGHIQRKLGRFPEAESLCRRALSLSPRLAWAHQVLGSAVLCQGRMAEAMACYRLSIALAPNDAETHYLLANALRMAGALHDALNSYRCAVQLAPDFVEALTNLGGILAAAGNIQDIQEAVRYLNKAYELRPDSPEVIMQIASVLQRDGRPNEALAKYRRAYQLTPNSLDVIGKLAEALEKTNQIDEAQALIEPAIKLAPDEVALLIPAARLARRAKRMDEAIDRFERVLRRTLEPELLGDVHLELGRLYDRQGEYDRAFAHIATGNEFIARAIGSVNEEHQTFINKVHRYHAYVHPPRSLEVRDEVEQAGDAAPAFLFGFARSGTTLLGQVLDTHPALSTLDEKRMVSVVDRAFDQIAQPGDEAVECLTAEQVKHLREVYFQEAARNVTLQPGQILVDKIPLGTIYAPLLWRLFPRARIILAIRHPCDVCLSCFMQNFSVTGALSSFFTFETGVAMYAKVMQLWIDAAATFPLNFHQIRYEDMVMNFDAEAQRLLDFLGVGWNDNVHRHDLHAMSHGKIATPSYHQVTQPIYQHAAYRWKRYEKQLEPFMPTLQPFIDYFGYAE
jgi:tetratricopeptide (TPR) repeat protein